ncbi:MAG: Cys-tRNA(Pro)/Cys-tRNA(Cys) deacylase [Candidatus Diapherotrites archaeon]|nr:Cys-tRNA(Pro)/Cys-tRNA(Cys) deacylase [Candidatus Diapherotrites archaeon]MDN5366793.1 Cys-tRNA(Pro)/Cys-tRNA(Cys) deacylase [Candidatus Diapherotrites archaeon]
MSGIDIVEEFIREEGLDAEVIRFAKPVRTVEDVEKMGIPPKAVVKTLIVKVDDSFVAVLIRGDAKLDLNKLKRVFGARSARMASPPEVREVTGVSIGAVSPLMPYAKRIKVIIDKGVFELEDAYGGGGDEKALVLFHPREVAEKLNAMIADVARA